MVVSDNNKDEVKDSRGQISTRIITKMVIAFLKTNINKIGALQTIKQGMNYILLTSLGTQKRD